MLVKELKKKVLKRIDEDFEIVDFSFALPYTYVLIKGKKGNSIGLAMTLIEDIQFCESEFDEIDVRTFIEKVDSVNIIERTIGLATINAVSQYYLNLEGAKFDDATGIIKDVKKVAIIGNMKPIVNKLKNRGYEVYVFERNPRLKSIDTLSDCFEYNLLPNMDAVLISGTSLINDSIDMILERSKKAKIKVLVGATAQALPEFFKGYLTHIASVKIINIKKVLLNLKLGSSSKLFSNEYSRKYYYNIL
ncbi:Rossmann-like domain-containing protein [Methanocaldococcus villosus]|nr:DUF364 domain-containing protein [Methanocaldococcus villosus]